MFKLIAQLLHGLAVRLDPSLGRRSRLVPIEAVEPVLPGSPKIDPRHVPAD